MEIESLRTRIGENEQPQTLEEWDALLRDHGSPTEMIVVDSEDNVAVEIPRGIRESVVNAGGFATEAARAAVDPVILL